MRNFVILAFLIVGVSRVVIGVNPLELENPRILGGTKSKVGQFPYVISVQRFEDSKMRHDCGGAIVSKYYVITAAHCTENRSASEFQVVAGAHNLRKQEDSQQRRSISKIFKHPKYNAGTSVGAYDVSILRVSKSFKLNDRVAVIPILSDLELPSPGEICDNVGWGNLFPISYALYRGSDELVQGKTEIVTNEECREAYHFHDEQLKTAVCAKAAILQGTCQGDSGGPLVCYKDDSIPYLAGVVSFGFQVCNTGTHPDVYSRMGNEEIYNFVKSTIRSKHTTVSQTEPAEIENDEEQSELDKGMGSAPRPKESSKKGKGKGKAKASTSTSSGKSRPSSSSDAGILGPVL